MGAQNNKKDMTEKLFTLKEVLAMCKEEHRGFFTFFTLKEGELFLRKRTSKGIFLLKKYHFSEHGEVILVALLKSADKWVIPLVY